MIAIIPFIILWVRMSRFKRLTAADLPNATEADLQQMRRASKTAFFVMLASTALSILPAVLVSSGPKIYVWDTQSDINSKVRAYNADVSTANILAYVFGLGGLLVAATFDWKAERIKRRGLGTILSPRGTIRWYHFLFIILLPYVAVFWGVFNLVTGRKRSGQILLVGSLIMLVIVFGGIHLANHASKKHVADRPDASGTASSRPTTSATVPRAATPEPSLPMPTVTTAIDAENVKILSAFDASGTVTPDWDRSQAMGTYKQKCQEQEVHGKILGMASIIPDGTTTKPSLIIVGDFFVQIDASAPVPKLLIHNDASAVVDKEIWKSSDGKSKLVFAHGSAYLLLSGDPNNFEPVGVLAPVIDVAHSTSSPGK